MNFIELLLIAIGLAMDAFAMSVCKGLSMQKIDIKKSLKVAIYFGFFQAIMPIIGYLLGYNFKDLIIQIDHYIAFILLTIIGINMIKEALGKNKNNINDKFDTKTLLLLAIATSIDALAVGITFAFLKTNIIIASIIIGSITFLLSFLGVKIGNKFGIKYEKKAEFVGGVILILMGFKILLEHLNVL